MDKLNELTFLSEGFSLLSVTDDSFNKLSHWVVTDRRGYPDYDRCWPADDKRMYFPGILEDPYDPYSAITMKGSRTPRQMIYAMCYRQDTQGGKIIPCCSTPNCINPAHLWKIYAAKHPYFKIKTMITAEQWKAIRTTMNKLITQSPHLKNDQILSMALAQHEALSSSYTLLSFLADHQLLTAYNQMKTEAKRASVMLCDEASVELNIRNIVKILHFTSWYYKEDQFRARLLTYYKEEEL